MILQNLNLQNLRGRKNERFSAIVGLCAPIIGLCTPIIGLLIYYYSFEMNVLSLEIRRTIWFYSVSAGFGGIVYFASTFESRYKLLLRLASFFWIYAFVFYAIFDIFNPDIQYKWIYVSTGGILICLILGLFFRQNFPT